MTKENSSGRTLLSIFYRSPRLMQGLCLISGLSLISSGLVLAQTDSFLDRGVAPPSDTIEAAPALAPEPPAQRKPVVTESRVEAVPKARKQALQLEPPARRKPVATESVVVPVSRARKPARERELVAPATPPAPAAAQKPVNLGRIRRSFQARGRKPAVPARVLEAPVRKPSVLVREPEAPVRKPSVLVREPEARVRKPSAVLREAAARVRKPSVLVREPEARVRKPSAVLREAAALGPIIAVQKKPVLAAPDLSLPDASTEAKTPPKVFINPAQIQESDEASVRLTNRYIDRTDYSIGATARYESPATVIVTDRSSGCRTVSQNGQLSSGICGAAVPSQQTATQQTATQQTATRGTATQLIATRGTATQLVPIRPTASQLIVSRPTASQLIVSQPKASQVVASRPTVSQLIASRPTVSQLIASRPTVSQLIASREIASPVIANQPTASRPSASQQTDLLDTADILEISRGSVREPQLAGVKRLPTPSLKPVEAFEPVQASPERLRVTRIRAPRQTTYSAYSTADLPSPTGQFYDSSSRSTSPMGLAYYNLTSRPEARPNMEKSNFMFPLALPGAISSMFGWRIHPITGDYRFHAGTDLGAPEGTPVLAAVAGDVIMADFLGGYGLTVVLQHHEGKDESLYGHLSEIFVQPGDRVEQGAVIGRVGSTGSSTGPHLHFEWRHLTSEGWVALDAGPNIEYALAQFARALQVAQATPQRGF